MRRSPFLWVLLFSPVACEPGAPSKPGDTGAEGPSDADSDAESDSDSGADTDTDTDTDSDSGGDSAPDSGGGPEPTGVVARGPALVITSPSAANRVDSATSTLDFGGTAGSEAIEVSYTTSAGASGVAEGTADWRAAVALESGVQIITFAATGADGTTSTLPVIVAYQPEISFDGRPELSDAVVVPGASVSATLGFSTAATVNEVRLVLRCMDGTAADAEMSQSGGAWSGTVSAPSSPSDCAVFARVDTSAGTMQSASSMLRVREPMTAARAEELVVALASVAEAMQGVAEWDAAVSAGEAVLAARADVATMAADERGLFWRTTDGWLFGATPGTEGTLGGDDPLLPWVLQTYRPGEVIADRPRDPLLDWGDDLACLAGEVSPFGYDEDESNDVIADVAAMEPGLVRFTAHGGLIPGGLTASSVSLPDGVWYLPWWYPTSSAGGAFYMRLAEGVAAADLPSYLESGGWVDQGAIAVVDPDGGYSFAVLATPDFFDSQITGDALAGAVVVATSCESAANGSLSAVLFEKGVSAYLGYTDVVYEAYADAFEAAMFGKWLPDYDASGDALPIDGLAVGFDAAWVEVGELDDDAWMEAFGDGSSGTDESPAEPSLLWNGPDDMVAKCCAAFFEDLEPGLSVPGTIADAKFGYSAAGVGDVDGDGFPEVAVGEPYGSSGVAWLFSGRRLATAVATASSPSPGDLALATLSDGEAGDLMGHRVAAGGDLDGDGLPDVIVSAPYNDGRDTNAGAVVVFGYDGLGVSEIARVEGEVASEYIGILTGRNAVAWRGEATLGDVSGDGQADLVVGSAYARTDDAGAAFFFFGPLGGTYGTDDYDAQILGTHTRAAAAYEGAILGDLDGDGIGEVGVFGDGDTTATVQVFQGPITSRQYLSSSTYSWVELKGDSSSDHFRVSGAGDTDGDGLADAWVGNYPTAEAYLVRGDASLSDLRLSSAADATWTGDSGSYGGWSVDAAGDIDCDGLDDVIVGAPAADTSAGALCVALGPLSGAIACAGDYAGAVGSGLGSAVTGVGDVDGRGCEDFVAGASSGTAGIGDFFLFTGE